MLYTKDFPYLYQRGSVFYFNRRVPSVLRRHYRYERIVISLRKCFLGISAPFQVDPDAKFLTQQMDPVKGARSLYPSIFSEDPVTAIVEKDNLIRVSPATLFHTG